ncbi:YeeE/YedE thiosulfate transporter family protein [Sulfurivirga sp.]|uniref:YeeE/YedE family protein n=1 Tax=Sulfurivirga sp. TaxID=2614236 RepID=UPI0025E0BEBC|nr:YeeE/YedE thiosulfate transporter family protein [Sulfurivirga sp.]
MHIDYWPAWIGGIGIGLFVLLHFWIIGRPAGCSTGYGNFCALACKRVKFFHTGEYEDINNTRLWFLLGIPIGGLISALLSSEPWHWSFSMGMYDAILPQSDTGKALWLIFGGMFLGFGARMAGACTTGHALVGGAMLNPPSLAAGVVFFGSAMLMTWLLFKV